MQVFTLYAFVGSICIISTLANELVAVLKTIGILSNLSPSFLGLSVMAWGNSVGDLIANIALARRGLQHMAFAACFGGPMFNTLLGFGVVLTIKIAKNKTGVAHVSMVKGRMFFADFNHSYYHLNRYARDRSV